MRVFKSVVSILSGLVLLTVLAPPAQATVPRIPITCGMVVQQDAVLYLTKDLFCPDFGVHVAQDMGQGLPGPRVLIDLRGHTLRGPGTGQGITAFTGGQGLTFVRVINGRLKNWDIAVGGDYDFRTRNVALVGNRVGFFCSANCVAELTFFKGNTGTGFFVGGEGSGKVTRSRFDHNSVGASVTFIWSLSVSSSTFFKNDVGVLANGAQVSIAKSLFVKNNTAVKVVTNDDTYPCANLSKVVFVKNGVRVDGPLCAA